jgi:hypothetical protein
VFTLRLEPLSTSRCFGHGPRRASSAPSSSLPRAGKDDVAMAAWADRHVLALDSAAAAGRRPPGRYGTQVCSVDSRHAD